jgi:hypothetical protein
MLSLKGYGASAWLTAIPKLPLYQLEPAEFRTALRFRLGMEQPAIFTSCPCACGHCPTPDAQGNHYVCCTRKGNHIKTRHDRIVMHFAQMLRTAGAITRTTGLSDTLAHRDGRTGRKLVPDAVALTWEDDGRDTCFDLAVTHPAAASYVHNASTSSLHSADLRETMKNNKYLDACRCEGMAFQPLVLETYGAVGQGAEKTIKKAVALIKTKLPEDALSKLGVNTWTASSFHLHFLQRIAIALQRGNAKCILKRAARDFRIAGRPEAPTSPPREVT